LREKYPECVAWVGACQKVDIEGNPIVFKTPRIGAKKQISNWSDEVWFSQPSCLFDGKIFSRLGGLDERLQYVMDVDLWMRLSEFGYMASTDKFVSCPRIHPNMKTFKDNPMRYAEHIFIDLKERMPDHARMKLLSFHNLMIENTASKELFGYLIKRVFKALYRKSFKTISCFFNLFFR
jgi:GT2 family glycosyltransferase